MTKICYFFVIGFKMFNKLFFEFFVNILRTANETH